MDETSIPGAHGLRWPILVALDEMGEESSLLDLQDRIVRRLKLSEGIAEIGAAEEDLPPLTKHLVQALADLHAAGAVASDETGRLWITDDGRRMTEGVDELSRERSRRRGCRTGHRAETDVPKLRVRGDRDVLPLNGRRG